jgi:acetyl-CoA carboxylase biotin carboxyl carrier protein
VSEKKKKPVSNKSAASSSKASNPMDLLLLEKMVKLMSQHDLNTVDVRDGDRRIVLRRGAVMAAAPAPVAYAPAHGVVPAPAPATSGGGAPAPAAADPDAGLTPVKSPMVGTFYASPTPDAKPFVTVGSSVDPDTDVCIIEAMKVFNNIKAEVRGKIEKVCVANGQTVEFGQPLFLVRT